VKRADPEKVVITGVGMVTPLGNDPGEVLRRIQAGDNAAASPTGFDGGVFECPVCAEVRDFDPQRYLGEAKMVRLMNRDAQLAVGAARLALEHAGVKSGVTYRPEEIALFGATGLAGLPLQEVAPLIKVSADIDGEFNLDLFGQSGLKAVRPILSFKILSNMPFCFVSINENIQGPNGIYTPWEGNGAQAVEAGIRALKAGDARCALVGGCDVKTHEMAFASLQQQGLFSSWCKTGNGIVPGEGAVFLVLENERVAFARGARIYGHIAAVSLSTMCNREETAQTRADALRALKTSGEVGALVSSSNADEPWVLRAAQISTEAIIRPKQHVGDLFAAAALLQLGLGALLIERCGMQVLATCFGHGSTQAAFALEKV
jgi:3-oxoacyl-[acyl-carrier-protein] synthase II